jgi:hypothetical protein
VPAPLINDLLLGCLAPATDPVALARLTRLSTSEWQQLALVAERHGLSPLLYDRLSFPAADFAKAHRIPHQEDSSRLHPISLSSPGTDGRVEESPISVPESVLQGLREAFLINTARNTLLYEDLAAVVATLQQHGIRVAVLKGAHLAGSVYRHIGLRTMADLDLLVAWDDLAETAALLRELGYASDASQDIKVQSGMNCHLKAFFKPRRPNIEVHWRIFDPAWPFKVDMTGITARLSPANLAGVQTQVLSPEDLLLHVCIHAAKDIPTPFCQGLRPLVDLAATIRHHGHELNWAQVQARAAEWCAGTAVYITLRLASDLLQAEVPRTVLNGLCPHDYNDSGYALAREQVLLVGAEPPAAGIDSTRLLHTTLKRDFSSAPLSARLRFLFRAAFPPRVHMAMYMHTIHSVPLTGARKYTCYLTRALDWAACGAHIVCCWAGRRGQAAALAKQLKKQAQLRRWMLRPDSQP